VLRPRGNHVRPAPVANGVGEDGDGVPHDVAVAGAHSLELRATGREEGGATDSVRWTQGWRIYEYELDAIDIQQ